jgi:hypothetical protein
MLRTGRDPRLERIVNVKTRADYHVKSSCVFVVSGHIHNFVLNFLNLVKSTLLSKRALLVVVLLLISGSVLLTAFNHPVQVHAAPSTYLNFQARLLNSSGGLVPDGTYNIEFKLYKSLAAGSSTQGVCVGGVTDDCEWLETRTGGNTITVTNGYMSVNLGSVTAFSTTIDWSSQQFLVMRIGGTGAPSWDTEMTPRISLTAVPLAYVANNVNSGNTSVASTNSAAAAVQSGNATGTTSNSGALTVQSGTATGTSGNLTVSTGNTGTGTSGNISLDVGTATTKGTISIGTTVSNSISIGNSTAATALTLLGGSTGGVNINNSGTGITAIGNGSAGAITIQSGSNITIGTIDATGTLLVLDTKNTAGDPTGVNGGMYYNSFLNKFRCDENGAWKDCDTAGSGVTSLSAIGATPNANGATITGSVLNLQPANGSFGGVVTTGTQTFAGDKTFTGTLSLTSTAAASSNSAVINLIGSTLSFVTGPQSGINVQPSVSPASASTQTYIGVRSAPNSTNANLSGGAIEAFHAEPYSTASAIGSVYGLYTNIGANATNSYGVYINNPYSTITNNNGIFIAGQTAGTNNTNLAIGSTTTGTYSIYNSSTSANLFGGSLQVGGGGNTTQLVVKANVSQGNTPLISAVTSTATPLFELRAPDIYGIGVGYHAGYNLTTSQASAFLGDFAGTATTGVNNTAVGYGALGATTTATDNVAVGAYSLTNGISGSYNTAVGSQTLQSTTGTNNTVLGFHAGNAVAAGNNNLLLGYHAGDTITSGSNNLIIGYNLGVASNIGSNQLNIGNILQSSDVTSGSLSIGNGLTNAAPVAATLKATGGLGSNIAGANFTLAGGIGTGTGTGGSINFQIAKPSGVGSSTPNSLATVLGISGVNGSALFQNSVDSTAAIQVQNAIGSSILNVSTISANQNILTNPSFEANTAGWTALTGGDTLTTTATAAALVSGTQALLDTTTATANRGVKYVYNFKSNTQYTFSVYAGVSTGSTGAFFELDHVENGTVLTTGCPVTQTLTTTMTWFTCTFTTGATIATGDGIQARYTSAVTAYNLYFDAAQLELGSTATTFVDQVYPNLIGNSSIENNANGWAARVIGTTPTVTQSDDYAQYGTKSLKLTTSTTIGNAAYYNYPFIANTRYSLNFWARNTAGAGTYTNLTVGINPNPTNLTTTTNDSNCTTSPDITTTGVTSTWTQYTCTFSATQTATVNSTSYFYIKSSNATSDTLYIDGVTLIAGGVAQPYINTASSLQVEPLYGNITLNSANNAEIQPWQTSPNALPAALSGHSSVLVNGYVYVIGGCTTVNFFCSQLSTVYYAKLNTDGSTGSWTTSPNVVSSTFGGGSAAAYNGYIYLYGAKNSNTSVNYTKVNADGSIGAWVASSNTTPNNKGEASTILANGYVYLFGGHNGGSSPDNTVIYSKLNVDGSLGAWTTSANNLSAGMKLASAVYANGYAYLFGGVNGGNSNDSTVQYAKMNIDGTTGTWANLTNLPVAIWGSTAAVLNGYVYIIGGNDSINSYSNVYYAKLNADGTLGTWNTSSNSLPAARDTMSTIVANGYIYSIGGSSNATTNNNVWYTSTSRLKIAGSLDLVGLSSQTLSDVGGGGSLTAGNATFIGSLDVRGQASFSQSLSVGGNLSVAGSAALKVSSDTKTIGANLYSGANFSTGWTTAGWDVATTVTLATHNTGNVTSLINTSVAIVAGSTYQVDFDLSSTPFNCGVAADTITGSLGGTTLVGGAFDTGALKGTGCTTGYSFVVTAGNTTGLTFTPTTNWRGTIVNSSISIKLLSGIVNPALTIQNAAGATSIELRASSDLSNLFLGTSAGQNSIGAVATGNTAVGNLALQQNTTGNLNTAIGSGALSANTSGQYNTAIGANALNYATAASYNVAIGPNALGSLRTGSNNVAIGNGALQLAVSSTNSTAVGNGALNAVTSGTVNTAVGSGALSNVTSGSDNLGIGYAAGVGIIGGSGNTFLGRSAGDTDYAGFSGLNTSQSVTIGANAVALQSNSIVIGASNNSNLKFGIGNPVPLNFFSGGALQDSGDGTSKQASVTSGSAAVTGIGTGWTGAMTGSQIVFPDGTSYIIASVANTTSLTLTSNATATETTKAYRMFYQGLQVKSDGTVYTQGGSTSQINVLNSVGISQLNVDTTNSRVTLGTDTTSTVQWNPGNPSGGTARYGASSVIYNNKMYSWGGWDGTTNMNTMDIFDIASNRWTTGTAGGTARHYHSAFVYKDKMYVWGGTNGSNLATVDIYTFATNTWSTGTAGGTARNSQSVVVYGTKAYFWGGTNGSNLATVDIYDMVSNTWSTGTSGGTARNSQSAVIYGTKMYVWGGTSGSALNTTDVYDVVANSWTTGVTGGTARFAQTAVLYGSKMYAWGGTNGTYGLNTTDVFDFTTSTWSTAATGGNGRYNHTAVAFGTRMYAWGGYNNNASLNSLDVYDFAANNWPSTITTVGGAAGVGRTSNVYGGKMYILGGTNGGSTFGSLDIFDFASRTWSVGATEPIARNGQTAVVYGSKLYVWGGQTQANTALNSIDIYDFTTNTWASGTAGGTPRRNHAVVTYGTKMYAWGGTDGTSTFPTVDIYDFVSGAWSTGLSGGTARYSASAVIYGTKMINWGGTNGSNLATVDIYDIVANSWSTGTAGGTARFGQVATVYNSKMYVAAGYNGADLNSVDIYDIIADSWTPGVAGGTPRYGPSAAAYGNKWYIYGGAHGPYLNTMDVMDFGSTTPTLLVLGSATTDPTGVNGGIYFNNASNNLRCYSAQTAWGDCSQNNNSFLQGGNSFGTTAVLGTNDNNGLTLKVNNTPVVTLSATGQASFKNTSNSTTAFQVQNAVGASVLNVDTTNARFSVGSLGTATSQLYVGGQAPVAVSNATTAGTTWGLFVAGDYAYTINSGTSFQIFSVANPTSIPAAISTTTVTGASTLNSVYVVGRYAYIIDGGVAKMYIYDIGNAASPTLVSTFTSVNSNANVAVSGKYAYLIGGSIQVVDITNPFKPVSVSNFVGASGNGIQIKDNYAYVGDGAGKLTAVNIANPASLSVASSSTQTGVYHVFTQGRYAYTTDATSIFQIFDISNPAATPTRVGNLTYGAAGGGGTGFPYSLFVQGRYAYVAGRDGHLYTIDVSTPASPTIVSNISAGGTAPLTIFVQGNYAYMVDSSGNKLYSYDLGGGYIQQLRVGGAEVSSLQVDADAVVKGNLAVTTGLSVSGNTVLSGDLGVSGKVVIANQVNSTSALQIQNATAVNVLNVDTTNSSVAVTSSSTTTAALTITNNSALTNSLVTVADSTVLTTTGSLLNLTANAATTATGLLVVNVSGLTTGYAQNINVNGAAVLTTGGALNVVGPTGAANLATGTGLVRIAATGVFTTTAGAGGLLQVAGNATTAGTIASISGTSLTSGVALSINANSGIALQTNNNSAIDLASGTDGNTAVLKIAQKATNTACASAGAEGLIIKNTGGTQVGHICIDGPTSATPNKLRYYAESFTTAATDVAENYSDFHNDLVAGDLVSIDTNNALPKAVTKATSANKGQLFGVISTNPGIALSGINDSNGVTDLINPKPVALNGRIPTHVNTENGIINIGDYLTISSTPGVATKIVGSGMVIGRALENYNGTTTGTIEVLAQNFYYAPTSQDLLQNGSIGSLTSNGTITSLNLTVTGSATINTLRVIGAAIVTTLEVTGDAQLDGNLTVNAITAHNVTVTGETKVAHLNVTNGISFGNAFEDPTTTEVAHPISKRFKASKALVVGDVVVLDVTAGDGWVTTTNIVGNRLVIGVAITTANNPGDTIEVAIGGTAKVNVKNLTINIGDLMHSDSFFGTATTIAHPNPGEILGKAIGTIDAQNQILVLLSLN